MRQHFFNQKEGWKLSARFNSRLLKVNQWTTELYPYVNSPTINKARIGALCTQVSTYNGGKLHRIWWGKDWRESRHSFTNEGLFKHMVMFFGMTNSPARLSKWWWMPVRRKKKSLGGVASYLHRQTWIAPTTTQFPWKKVSSSTLNSSQWTIPQTRKQCPCTKSGSSPRGNPPKNGTIHMDQETTQGVAADWPRPTQRAPKYNHSLGFTGLHGTYTKLLKNCETLLDSPRKPPPWHLGPKQQKHSLRNIVKNPWYDDNQYTQPDYGRDFIIHMDCISLWHGCHTLTRGEIPKMSKTTKPLLNPISILLGSSSKPNETMTLKRECRVSSPWKLATSSSRYKNPFTVVRTPPT